MNHLLRIMLLGLLAALGLPSLHAAEADVRRAIPMSSGSASPDDLSRLIAGLPPQNGGAAANLAATSDWIAYSNNLDRRWQRFEAGHLKGAREWSATEMVNLRPATVFYPFSGPDFSYVHAMFPGATTYILCGLEPVGDIPSLPKMQPLPVVLGWLQVSLSTLMDAGYFVTKEMRVNLKSSPLQGTAPILCVLISRAGGQVTDISSDGQHVEIHFVLDGRARRLFYFSTDISDGGLGKKSAFLQFVRGQNPGAAYVKADSYLLHQSGFSTIRNFMLKECGVILQDDSGIPIRYFDTGKWKFRLYGNYSPPLDIFREYYQSDLAALYGKVSTMPLKFGVGYQWNPSKATLIIATRH